jgi:hypothetical protein
MARMKRLSMALVLLAGGAWADVTYNTVTKNSTGGVVNTAKTLLKGNKIKTDLGHSVTVMDFDAKTVTTIDTSNKTYRVTPIAKMADRLDKVSVSIELKTQETGAKKVIREMACRQVIITLTLDAQPSGSLQGMELGMELETEAWVTNDVPGIEEITAMNKRSAEIGFFEGPGGNPQMKKILEEIEREMARISGVPVLSVTKIRLADNARNAQMQAQMEQVRAQMEELKKQGGPAAAEIEKALSAMGGGGKYLMEITAELSDISLATIPASEFAIPEGFKQQN